MARMTDYRQFFPSRKLGMDLCDTRPYTSYNQTLQGDGHMPGMIVGYARTSRQIRKPVSRRKSGI